MSPRSSGRLIAITSTLTARSRLNQTQRPFHTRGPNRQHTRPVVSPWAQSSHQWTVPIVVSRLIAKLALPKNKPAGRADYVKFLICAMFATSWRISRLRVPRKLRPRILGALPMRFPNGHHFIRDGIND